MKKKRITKRQILFGVCCLLFFMGIMAGCCLSIRNSEGINILSNKDNITFIKEFIDIFKFTAIVLILAAIPGTSIFQYFLVIYKGFSIGYTAFSIIEDNILNRILITSSFLPPELLLSYYIIFCTSYFLSNKKPEFQSNGYKQYIKKRNTEITILVISGLLITLICAFWKKLSMDILF